MFYARAIPLLAFFTAVLFLVMVGAGFAMAQEAGPVTVDQIAAPVAPEGYTGIAGLADSLLTGVASALALLVTTIGFRLWNLIPMWAQAAIDRLVTTDAKEWGEVMRTSTEDCVRTALIKLKMDPASIKSWEEKNAALALAGQVVDRFYPELKSFTVDALDKNQNGVPDFLELALAKIAPQTALISQPEFTQAFAAPVEPQPRGVKPRDAHKEIQAFAAKYAPKRAKAGTVQ